MNPEEMHPDPEVFLDQVSAQSNRALFGAKLWWMLVARSMLGVWPSKARIDEAFARRKAQLHEELRVRVARKVLDEIDGGDR